MDEENMKTQIKKAIEKESEMDEPIAIEKRSLAADYMLRLNLYQVNDLLDYINNDSDKEECAKEVNDVLLFRGYRERFEINKETGRAQMKREEE